MLYQDQDDGYISNLYNYQLINKTGNEDTITFVCGDLPGILIEVVGNQPVTKANQVVEGAVFIKIPKDLISTRNTELTIKVMANGKQVDEAETSFMGPR